MHGLVSYTHANNDGKPARTDYANGIYVENVYDALDRTVGIMYNGIVRYSVTYNFYQNNTYRNYNYAYQYYNTYRVFIRFLWSVRF